MIPWSILFFSIEGSWKGIKHQRGQACHAPSSMCHLIDLWGKWFNYSAVPLGTQAVFNLYTLMFYLDGYSTFFHVEPGWGGDRAELSHLSLLLGKQVQIWDPYVSLAKAGSYAMCPAPHSWGRGWQKGVELGWVLVCLTVSVSYIACVIVFILSTCIMDSLGMEF